MSDLFGALTRTDDDFAIHFERDYATSPADLWAAVTEPERVARWLAPVDGDLRPGGSAVVHFEDGDTTFAIDTCAAPDTLAVRWLHEDRDSVVRVSVFPLGADRSRLVLVHEALTEKQAPDYAGGWHWHLDTLDAVLGGREAERDHWDALRDHYLAEVPGVTTARL